MMTSSIKIAWIVFLSISNFSYANDFHDIRLNDVRYVAVGKPNKNDEFIELCRFGDPEICKRLCEDIQIPGDESVKKISFEKGPYVVLFDGDMNPVFAFESRLDGWNEVLRAYHKDKKLMIERSDRNDRRMFISGRLGSFGEIIMGIWLYYNDK